MKRYTILLFPLILSAAVLAGLFFMFTRNGDTADISGTIDPGWQIKQKETVSRLLEVPIILYHDIDGKGPFAVTSEAIRSHFEYFRQNNIKVVPLSDLLNRLDNPKPYTERVIVITFDDGYKSMYTKLMPLASEFGYPITLFVYTENVYKNGEKVITWEELKEMQANGIDIQSHTLSHPDLTKLSAAGTEESRRRLFKELYLSRILMEKKLDKPITYLAFPFGRYDLDTVRSAMEAGYTHVFTTDDGSNVVTRNNYCIRRHHIKRDYSIDKIIEIIR